MPKDSGDVDGCRCGDCGERGCSLVAEGEGCSIYVCMRVTEKDQEIMALL